MGQIKTMLEQIKGKRIYFDTNPFIYFVEEHDIFYEAIKPIFQMVNDDIVLAFTSEFTLTEVLIKPHRDKDQATIESFEGLLIESGYFSLLGADKDTFLAAAKIGGETIMRTPDAIHMATAIENKCDFFITNDKRIRDYQKVKVIQISELLPS